MRYSLEHEYEIKLRIPADAIDRIGTLLANLKRFAKAERVRLQSSYYDDQDFSLLHQGLCLRIVDNGTSMVQTLKDLYPKSGQCPLRQELNVQLSSNALDLSAIKEPLENHIKAPGHRKWQVCFSSSIMRHNYFVELAQRHYQISIDQGTLFAANKTMAICEMEIESCDQQPFDMAQLTKLVPFLGGFTQEQASKAQRGYDLLQRERAKV